MVFFSLLFLSLSPPTVDADKLEDHLKAYGITQEVQAMRQICSKKSIQIQKKQGLVMQLILVTTLLSYTFILLCIPNNNITILNISFSPGFTDSANTWCRVKAVGQDSANQAWRTWYHEHHIIILNELFLFWQNSKQLQL